MITVMSLHASSAESVYSRDEIYACRKVVPPGSQLFHPGEAAVLLEIMALKLTLEGIPFSCPPAGALQLWRGSLFIYRCPPAPSLYPLPHRVPKTRVFTSHIAPLQLCL